jgi:hypothetical protein
LVWIEKEKEKEKETAANVKKKKITRMVLIWERRTLDETAMIPSCGQIIALLGPKLFTLGELRY